LRAIVTLITYDYFSPFLLHSLLHLYARTLATIAEVKRDFQEENLDRNVKEMRRELEAIFTMSTINEAPRVLDLDSSITFDLVKSAAGFLFNFKYSRIIKLFPFPSNVHACKFHFD